MKDVVTAIIVIVANAMLPLLMFAQGLGIDWTRDLTAGLTRRRLVVAGVAATLFLVPLVALPLLLFLPMPPDVRIGLALLAACPLAPGVHAQVSKLRGDQPFATTVHVLAAVASVLTTPLVLLAMGAILGFRAVIQSSELAYDLLRSVLLPLFLGALLGAYVPRARRFERPLTAIAAGIYACIGVLAISQKWRLLFDLEPSAYLAFALFTGLALLVGEVAAGKAREHAPIVAIECATRNPASALAIATWSFPYVDPLLFVVPFTVVFAIITALYTSVRRRRARLDAAEVLAAS